MRLGRVRRGSGPNGSGKMTLIGLLVGWSKAKTGRIRIGGREIGKPLARKLDQRDASVFQNRTDQLFAATVEEDASPSAANPKLPEEEVQARVTKALAAVAARCCCSPGDPPPLRRAEAGDAGRRARRCALRF